MRSQKIKFIDLSIPIESVPSDPESMIPQLEYIDHRGGLASAQEIFGCRPEDFPLGLGWAVEKIILSTHSGTHLDAPWHYAPVSEGKKAKTIDQIPLEWCYGNGVVLDFRRKKDGALITVEDLEKALKKIRYRIKPRDIVLIMTGADRYWGKPEYLVRGCGMGRESTLWLLDQGVKVVGIDAWSWDRPLPLLRKEFEDKKDPTILWAAHFAGIEKEYLHIEKMANLQKLPSHGFTLICFPVKIRAASAGWVRPVAMVREK
jgi:kynurenine formamidase